MLLKACFPSALSLIIFEHGPRLRLSATKELYNSAVQLSCCASLLLFLFSLPPHLSDMFKPLVMLHLHPQLLTAGHAATPEERKGGWNIH